MIVLAKTENGHEYIYNINSVHMVSKKHCKIICNALNRSRYGLHSENEKWHIYNVGTFETVYHYAKTQAFRIRSGKLVEMRY